MAWDIVLSPSLQLFTCSSPANV